MSEFDFGGLQEAIEAESQAAMTYCRQANTATGQLPVSQGEAGKTVDELSLHNDKSIADATAEEAGGSGEHQSFYFIRTNDIYHISGFGERVTLQETKGLNVIARLIETPGVAVPMRGLLEATADQEADADNRSQQPAMDAEMKKSLREHLADLRGELDKAKDNDDLAAQERCEREIEDIKDHVIKSEGPGGKDKDLNDSIAPMRKLIRGRLDTAYEKLGSENTPPTKLAVHFMAAIGYEKPAYIYRILPGDPINWQLNKC